MKKFLVPRKLYKIESETGLVYYVDGQTASEALLTLSQYSIESNKRIDVKTVELLKGDYIHFIYNKEYEKERSLSNN